MQIHIAPTKTMIVSKLDNSYATGSTMPIPEPSGSSSWISPPPFEDTSGTIIPLLPDAEPGPHEGMVDPPPEFSHYEAEYFTDSSGDIISHDPHLNEDGEALYRFLLAHASTPPSFFLHCFGSHTEEHTRWVSSNNNRDGTSMRTERYTETITDFDFRIDLSQYFQPNPFQWSISDSEPAYRGRMVREVDINGQRRSSTRAENSAAKNWRAYRSDKGLPPWITENSGQDLRAVSAQTAVFQSSKSLRQWADDYCTSNKLLKEFTFEKVAHGWDIGALTKSIQTTINSTHYTGTTKITFETSGSNIHIRPSTRFSRTLSNKWFKFLLWILLIYPFIWLFKRFHSRGGGEWRVCGSAFALKEWSHLPDSLEGEDVAQYLIRTHEESASGKRLLQGHDPWELGRRDGSELRKLIKTRRGISALVGVQEGEWFRNWEGTIRRAVMARLRRMDAMTAPDDQTNAGAWLAGYTD